MTAAETMRLCLSYSSRISLHNLVRLGLSSGEEPDLLAGNSQSISKPSKPEADSNNNNIYIIHDILDIYKYKSLPRITS